jgi:hypothetical protein
MMNFLKEYINDLNKTALKFDNQKQENISCTCTEEWSSQYKIKHIVTYADNLALTFFEKQDFIKLNSHPDFEMRTRN